MPQAHFEALRPHLLLPHESPKFKIVVPVPAFLKSTSAPRGDADTEAHVQNLYL